jgi:hypothetical protein
MRLFGQRRLIGARELDRTFTQGQEPGQCAEKRGLAGAIASEHDQSLAGAQFKIDIADDGASAAIDAQAPRGKDLGRRLWRPE